MVISSMLLNLYYLKKKLKSPTTNEDILIMKYQQNNVYLRGEQRVKIIE